MSDLFNDSNESFYDPSKDENKYEPLKEGDYEAHIVGLELKENITVQGKFLADIFIPNFKVAGGDFKNRKVKSKGIFRFKTPDKDKYPNLSSNNGSNKSYMNFISTIGMQPESKEVDGNTVYSLPYVTAGDIEGKACMIRVEHDNWTNRDGEPVVTPKVTNLFKWEGGEDEDGLPF
jgi:hypothetical protein